MHPDRYRQLRPNRRRMIVQSVSVLACMVAEAGIPESKPRCGGAHKRELTATTHLVSPCRWV